MRDQVALEVNQELLVGWHCCVSRLVQAKSPLDLYFGHILSLMWRTHSDDVHLALQPYAKICVLFQCLVSPGQR